MFLYVLIFNSLCANSAEDVFIYESSKHGISFNIPVSFLQLEGEEAWSAFKWKDAENNITFFFRVNWNKDLIFFTPEESLDIYLSNYRSGHLTSSIYLKSSTKFPLSTFTDAMDFEAVDGDNFVWGVHIAANNREYILKLSTLEKNAETSAFKNAVKSIRSIKIEDLTEHQKYVNYMLRKLDLRGSMNVKEILNYGQQLMSSKENYIINYPRAIKEFRKALNIMQNLDPKPNEYKRALRLITVAKELQRNAYDKHELNFIKVSHLRDWENAYREAKSMKQLMSDDKENPKTIKAANLVYEIGVSVEYS